MSFAIGDLVVKDTGDYTFEGEVVAVIVKRSKAIRFCVEDDRGLLFIFSAGQLRLASEQKPDRMRVGGADAVQADVSADLGER